MQKLKYKFHRIKPWMIFILLGAGVLLLTAANRPYDFDVARLHYEGGGDWYNGPSEIPNLMDFLHQHAQLNVPDNEIRVKLTDPELFTHPFLFMTGHGNIHLSDDEIRILRQYLTTGGFLFANDDYGMDKPFRREMKKVFPDKDFVELPFDHPIYHIKYEFPDGPPKIHKHNGKPPQGFGLFHNGRLIVYYDYEADIADGWDDPDVHHDPPEKRQEALKMGTNIVLYVLTH